MKWEPKKEEIPKFVSAHELKITELNQHIGRLNDDIRVLCYRVGELEKIIRKMAKALTGEDET